MVIEWDHLASKFSVESYTPVSIDRSSDLNSELTSLYISACDSDIVSSNLVASGGNSTNVDDFVSIHLSLKKKYKPVAKKVKPVATHCPEKFRIERKIIGDPLANMPVLNPGPPPFVPTGRYTQERKEKLDKDHPEGFLWPQE